MKKFFLLVLSILCASGLSAQEILLSSNEVYYDFLGLGGFIERPYLNYRTLSDSSWDASENANPVWAGVHTGTKVKLFDGKLSYRIYGPEVFGSYNTANPYGQNDSTLWQGKGFNTLVSAGARLESFGFELTLRPEFALSENRAFDMAPTNPAYTGNAAQYGYYGASLIDAPQRFGDGLYYEFNWGDSEVRYSWKTLTIGFGTQNIWLGPARINPILHSNNAPPYPKLDIGLRKQGITIPKLNWYLGDIEFRSWWGYLSESDYFAQPDSGAHNMITGLTLAYSAPSFLKGLTIGLNRIMLSKWEDMDYKGILALMWPFLGSAGTGSDRRDHRLTFTFDYVFPSVGFELYFEWGRDDFPSNINWVIRDLFDTEAYTFGAVKNLLFNDKFQGKLLLEITHIESNRGTAHTFYAHHIIRQGHTNRGQWLGAGLGTGGNSQYLGFTLFYPKGYASIFVQRQGIDLDYAIYYSKDIKAGISLGINNYINLFKYLGVFSEVIYSDMFNPTFDGDALPRRRNVYLSLGLKFIY